jgi:thiol:disulfide interchange protein DsbD
LTLVLAAVLPAAGCGNGEETGGEAIAWSSDIDAAITKAGDDGVVMVDFTASWCPPCHAMEDSTFSDPDVIRKAASFITVRIDVDEQRATAEKYGGNARKYGGIGIPNILFLDGQGRRLKQVVGYHGPERLVAVMDSVLTM